MGAFFFPVLRVTWSIPSVVKRCDRTRRRRVSILPVASFRLQRPGGADGLRTLCGPHSPMHLDRGRMLHHFHECGPRTGTSFIASESADSCKSAQEDFAKNPSLVLFLGEPGTQMEFLQVVMCCQQYQHTHFHGAFQCHVVRVTYFFNLSLFS